MEDLISKRTRNAFREFLVGWVLRDIDDLFDEAGVAFNGEHEPDVPGQRRSRVEQYYSTVDFSDPDDVLRVLEAYQNLLYRTENDPYSDGNTRELVQALESDGFSYEMGTIKASDRNVRNRFHGEPTISEVTRRAIFDELQLSETNVSGRLSEIDFLNRVYKLSKLPSHDSRCSNMEGDIWQHTVNNDDWEPYWFLTDSRLELLDGADELFLRFLCEMVHPVVCSSEEEARKLVESFNTHLSRDGWRIFEDRMVSGRPLFVGHRAPTATVALVETDDDGDILNEAQVRRALLKCDDRLARNDLDGAVTSARSLVENVLVQIELKLKGRRTDHKRDLPSHFTVVRKLLLIDEDRDDLDQSFKTMIKGLVHVVNGLAPIRNKQGDAHAAERPPAPHHARFVVNAAKSICAFLVESYRYQVAKGRVSPVEKKAAS